MAGPTVNADESAGNVAPSEQRNALLTRPGGSMEVLGCGIGRAAGAPGQVIEAAHGYPWIGYYRPLTFLLSDD